jgi:two-component system OmpR family sensor kinase
MSPAAARPTPGLTRTLMRALLPWMAGFWLATSVAVGWFMQHELGEQIDSGLVETAERLLDLAAHDARNHTRPSERDGTLYRLEVPHSNLTRPDHEGMMYQVVNDRHELLLRSADAPREALRLPLETGFTEANDFRIYTLAHPTLPMFIHVGDPLSHRRASLREALFWLVVPLGIVLPVLALLIQGLTTRVMRPASRLARELRRRDGQNLSPLRSDGLPAELQSIAVSANQLLQRLSDALDTERALAANAAHELRTPLATGRLSLESALARLAPATDAAAAASPSGESGVASTPPGPATPPAPAADEVRAALDAITRLSRRSEKLLQLSRAESGAALSQDPVDLGRLAAVVAQEFWADPALLGRLQLVLPEDEDVVVRGDVDALAIALRNLVENAVRYAPEGPIVIEVAAPGLLSVRDHGPGIPPGQLESVLARHGRGEAARGQLPVQGFGLGLSIVRTIVERQGGELILLPVPPSAGTGLLARLRLRPGTSA